MNKRYIDFVPVASGSKGRSAVKVGVGDFDDTSVNDTKAGGAKSSRASGARVSKVNGARVDGGRMDNVGSGSVRVSGSVRTVSEMVQRTSGPHKTTKVSELKVDEIFEERMEKPRAGVTAGIRRSGGAAAVPRAKFVNTEKVTKRPLSKNVYTKQVVEPKEEVATKPVKIIDKPEKDSKAGMVIAVIITIVLGAAVGTVAFLLLPK